VMRSLPTCNSNSLPCKPKSANCKHASTKTPAIPPYHPRPTRPKYPNPLPKNHPHADPAHNPDMPRKRDDAIRPTAFNTSSPSCPIPVDAGKRPGTVLPQRFRGDFCNGVHTLSFHFATEIRRLLAFWASCVAKAARWESPAAACCA